MIDPQLTGRVVLVTGASSGIGAAAARAFAAQGATVVVHFLDAPAPGDGGTARRGREAAEALKRELEERGARVALAPGDLADPETAVRLFDVAEFEVGPVDVLVNNAAHFEGEDSALHVSAAGFDRTFAVNTRAPALLAGEFARRYRTRPERDGRIVNVTTDAARAFAGQIAYGASKAALEALTRSMAIELGPLGITVNAIAPGPVQTGWITREIEHDILPWIPMGRVGAPEEIADTAVFLASAQARWITGQVIQVAGGHAL